MLDANLMISDLQTLVLTAAAATLSTKSVDLGAAATDDLGNTLPRDLGKGMNVELLCQICTTFLAAGGAANLTVELVMADDEALTSNLVVLQKTPAIAKASLVSGYTFRLGGVIPPGTTSRYVGARYTVDTNDGTAGTITTTLVLDRPTAFRS